MIASRTSTDIDSYLVLAGSTFGINAVVRLMHRFLCYDMAAVRAFIRMLKPLFFPEPEDRPIRKLRKQLEKLKRLQPERNNGWGMFLGDRVKDALQFVTCKKRRFSETKQVVKAARKTWKQKSYQEKLRWRKRAEVRAANRKQDLSSMRNPAAEQCLLASRHAESCFGGAACYLVCRMVRWLAGWLTSCSRAFGCKFWLWRVRTVAG